MYEERKCPACQRELERDDSVVSAGDVHDERLRVLDSAVAAGEAALGEAQGNAEVADGHYRDTVAELRRESQKATAIEEELRGLNARLPVTEERVNELADEFRAGSNDVEEAAAEQKTAEQELTEFLQSQRSRVEAITSEVADHFKKFASRFLVEKCDLVFRWDRRRFGKEGEQFEFPVFEVRMSSAVAPDLLAVRRGPDTVSESQRLFLEIAFRMAAIAVAAGESATMMALETPEASLDSLFVARAGQLLGKFTSQAGPSRAIASSSLRILPVAEKWCARFLAVSVPGQDETAPLPHKVDITQRDAHVLNLLVAAKPTAALREHRTFYEKLFAEAVYPDKAPAEAKA